MRKPYVHLMLGDAIVALGQYPTARVRELLRGDANAPLKREVLRISQDFYPNSLLEKVICKGDAPDLTGEVTLNYRPTNGQPAIVAH